MVPYFTLICVIIAFMVSIGLFFQSKADLYLRLFPFFLFLDMIAEYVSYYVSARGQWNLVVSNPFTVFAFCFYFFTLRQIVNNPIAKKIIRYVLFIYPVIALFNIYFLLKNTDFHSVTYSVGCLLVVAICIYYFLELFQQTRMVNLLRQPAFWICSGLLFYFACSFPLYGLNDLVYRNASPTTIHNLMILFNLLDVFLYSSFIIAFVCRIRVRKSML